MISLAWLECRLPVGSSAKQQRRLMDDGPCDPYQLLLPARELAWVQVLLGDNLETIRRIGDKALQLATWDVFVRERQIDVFQHREIVEQVITLKNHADILLRHL